jgi:prolyl-tRNA synthetase
MAHGDDNGLNLPPRVAPIQVVIVPIQQNQPGVLNKAYELEKRLKAKGIRVKVDSSDKSPGWKFAEYEMKGVPLRLEIGPRDLKAGLVSGALRHNHEKFNFADAELEAKVETLLDDIHDAMYQKALTYLLDHTFEVHTIEELEDALNNKLGYAKMMWSGDQEHLDIIKERFQATARALPFNQTPFSEKCLVSGKKAKYVVIVGKAY